MRKFVKREFDLLEILCMDLYRISVGDNGTVRYKQNFESSKFDLDGLHRIYIYIYWNDNNIGAAPND